LFENNKKKQKKQFRKKKKKNFLSKVHQLHLKNEGKNKKDKCTTP